MDGLPAGQASDAKMVLTRGKVYLSLHVQRSQGHAHARAHAHMRAHTHAHVGSHMHTCTRGGAVAAAAALTLGRH